MLVLERKEHERIIIDNDIVIEVVRIWPNKVRLGILARPEIAIVRQELLDREPGRERKGKECNPS